MPEVSCSKTEGTTNGKCILDPIDYCITEDLENSSATFTFPNSAIRMIGFSLLSAHADRNTMNMDIIGIPAQSENWEEICHIRKDKEYFRGKANYAECVSNKFMKAIKLIQIGTNNQGSFSFVIRYFDFFGSLTLSSASFITFCMKKSFRFNSFLFLNILF